jgi:deoxyribonuclease V
MHIHALHRWDLTPVEAVALQRDLAGRVDVCAPLTNCRLVAGADVSYNRFSNIFWAGVVVLHFPDLTVVEKQGARRESPFPYIPGLLSFREAPALLEAFARVQADPDVILFDGQGIAHPRRLGIASHMGLFLDKPCIGCAKSLLTGKYKDPGPKAGAVAPLTDRGEVIHAAGSSARQ